MRRESFWCPSAPGATPSPATGVGGLALEFALKNGQSIKLTTVACALILGIITNLMLSGKKEQPGKEEPQQVIK